MLSLVISPFYSNDHHTNHLSSLESSLFPLLKKKTTFNLCNFKFIFMVSLGLIPVIYTYLYVGFDVTRFVWQAPAEPFLFDLLSFSFWVRFTKLPMVALNIFLVFVVFHFFLLFSHNTSQPQLLLPPLLSLPPTPRSTPDPLLLHLPSKRSRPEVDSHVVEASLELSM